MEKVVTLKWIFMEINSEMELCDDNPVKEKRR